MNSPYLDLLILAVLNNKWVPWTCLNNQSKNIIISKCVRVFFFLDVLYGFTNRYLLISIFSLFFFFKRLLQDCRRKIKKRNPPIVVPYKFKKNKKIFTVFLPPKRIPFFGRVICRVFFFKRVICPAVFFFW